MFPLKPAIFVSSLECKRKQSGSETILDPTGFHYKWHNVLQKKESSLEQGAGQFHFWVKYHFKITGPPENMETYLNNFYLNEFKKLLRPMVNC